MEAAAASARPVLRVAAICGSLRKASFNRGLLRAAAEVCEDSIPGLRVDELDISDLPLINTDLETGGGTGFPPAVEAFRAKVCQADCFLFGAPEYNYSIAMFMSQASSSTCRTRRSNAARNALQPRPLAVVAASTEPTGVDLEAPVDYDTGLPLIICPDCRDVRVFAANTKSGSNIGRRGHVLGFGSRKNMWCTFMIRDIYRQLPRPSQQLRQQKFMSSWEKLIA